MESVAKTTVPPVKLYLALLNGGWLRREFSYSVLPKMLNTPGVQIIWEDPKETWSQPISSNRNLIVLRFLQTDCDFLLMIDDDVVPLFNPAELVFANRDIIGCPAKVRSTGQLIAWTAYTNHPSGEGYSTLNLNAIDDYLDLIPVDCIGSGCLLVRRRVFENPQMKAPFHTPFDENGVLEYGTDFAFCRKAKAAGFEVHSTVQRRCEHFKELGFLDYTGWDQTDEFTTENVRYEIPWAGMSITMKDWRFIQEFMNIIKPRRVLEFGTGLSSLLMAERTVVHSFDTDAAHAERILEKHLEWCRQSQEPGKPRPPTLHVFPWDGKNFDPGADGNYDFAFVDGPEGEGRGGVGRQWSIKVASEHCRHIIVHDAGREFEEHWQRMYLRGKYRLVARSAEHTTRCQYWVKRDVELTNENFKSELGIEKQ